MARAFAYINRKEVSKNINVVHFYSEFNQAEEKEIQKSLEVMEELYPEIHIKYLTRHGYFGPAIIEEISQELQVPKNNIFIGAPEEKHKFSVEDLGGVRVIF